jgi:hypothetical protein
MHICNTAVPDVVDERYLAAEMVPVTAAGAVQEDPERAVAGTGCVLGKQWLYRNAE